MDSLSFVRPTSSFVFVSSFKGLAAADISNFVRYRQGKSFCDLKDASYHGRLSALHKGKGSFQDLIGSMAQRIEEVLEINTKAFDGIYGIPEPW